MFNREFELPLLPSVFVIFAVGVILVGLIDFASNPLPTEPPMVWNEYTTEWSVADLNNR